ncbi:hypothetical protein ANO14919_142750 [Xylariales sp. No.14919]|nr:hypothetical protein ANO14919_142750 [Xylariales sp. No.14919]
MFVCVSRIPWASSGKIDRRKLRNLSVKIDWTKAPNEYRPPRRPLNATEHTIQRICAEVLDTTAEDINLDMGFFGMGGDSIRVMQLVSCARRSGLPITVRQDDVAEVLPATEVQAFSATRPQNYWFLELTGALDYDRLKLACSDLVQRHAILRTVLVPDAKHILQVVLHRLPPSIVECETDNSDLFAYARTLSQIDSASQVLYGMPPLAFTLIRHHRYHHMMILRLSHARYDGLSIPILMADLLTLYEQRPIEDAVTFAAYTRYCTRSHTDEAYGFWRDLLHGASMTSPSGTDISKLVMRSDTHLVEVEARAPLPSPPPDITMATIIKAAWSMVQARLLRNTSDLVFGQLVSGRNNLSEAGLENVVGPCLNRVPVRVQLPQIGDDKDDEPVSALLRCLQDQHAASLAFETVPLHSIVARCTSWSDGETDFGSIVHHRQVQEQPILQSGSLEYRVDAWSPVSLPEMNIWVTSLINETKEHLKQNIYTRSKVATAAWLNLLIGKLYIILRAFYKKGFIVTV